MKAKTTSVVGVAVLLIVAVLAWNQTGPMKSYAVTYPEPNAESVWSYIKNTSPYTEWQTLPGYAGMYPGKNPHGKYLKLYVNEPGLFSIQNKINPMEDKSMFVMENYAADQKTLKSVAVMYKVKGYNPDAGDWFWALIATDGKAMKAGKVEWCITCHTDVKNQDYHKELPQRPPWLGVPIGGGVGGVGGGVGR